MTTKKCFKCGNTYDLSEFYPHKQMADKHLNKCKYCNRKDTTERVAKLKANDPVWAEKERLRQIKKERDYCNRFPEKSAAHKAIGNKKKNKGMALHHWSYRPEHRLDVIEIKREHHLDIHSKMIYDQERCQYRKIDGNLIDSREKAIEHINASIGLTLYY
jgi:hypothetical protein